MRLLLAIASLLIAGSAYAFGGLGAAGVEVTRRYNGETFRDLYIVSIGINRYGGTQGNLEMCVADAEEFAAKLSQRSSVQFKQVHAIPLIDVPRTRITQTLDEVAKKATADDIVIFFFAGRGMMLGTDHQPYLLPSGPIEDGDSLGRETSRALSQKYIGARYLIDWALGLRAQRQAFFLDTCAAGDFAPIFCEAIQKKAREYAGLAPVKMAVFGSCGPGGESRESARFGHGLFTYSLLDALARKDKPLTLRRLEAVGYERMLEISDGLQFPSTYFTANFDLQLGPAEKAAAPVEAMTISLLNPKPTRSNSVLATGARTVFHFKITGHFDKVTVNGIEAKEDDNGYAALLTLQKGMNKVEVKVYPIQGEPIAEAWNVERTETAAPVKVNLGKRYALLIGIDNYKPGWHRLANPAKDAEEIAAILKDRYGFENITLLTQHGDEAKTGPTKKDIQDAILNLRKIDFGPNDELLVFIAAHGLHKEGFARGMLVTGDSLSDTDDTTASTFVDHSFLRDNLDMPKCRHVLLLLDTCFSATFGDSGGEGDAYSGLFATMKPDPPLQGLMADKADMVNAFLIGRSREYVASGEKWASDGYPGGHSPFASALLKILRDGETNGVVTSLDLLSKLSHTCPGVRPGTFNRDSGAGHFVFMSL